MRGDTGLPFNKPISLIYSEILKNQELKGLSTLFNV